MVDYKDIWSDTVLIIALLISVFAFSAYSPDVVSPTLLAPQTELIFSQSQESAVKPISTILHPVKTTARITAFPDLAMAIRIQDKLSQVAFRRLAAQVLQYVPTHHFAFLLPHRQLAEEAPISLAKG